MREVIAIAARTHPAYVRFQNGKIANKIVDLLTPEYIPEPPLPLAQELMDVLAETLEMIHAGVEHGLSNKGRQQWYNIERRLLELCEHASESKFYITLNTKVYLKDLLRKVESWRYDQARLNLYGKRIKQLCRELQELVEEERNK